MTTIYITDNVLNSHTLEELLELIPRNIVEFPEKYKITGDRLASASAWYVLYKYLKEDYNIDLSNEHIITNVNRKPCINGIFFNISHSFNMSAVIISDSECGIDIEYVNPEVNHELLSTKILNRNECFEYLRHERAPFFTLMWTKKEAMFKYNGTGIMLNHFKDLDTSKVRSIEITDTDQKIFYISYMVDKPTEEIMIKQVRL